MPATINGTSGFGGNLTGNVTGNADTSTVADKLTTTTGSAPVYACRAWVNFDGTRNEGDTGGSTNGANVKIHASGNVASVLKNGTGDYTITFTTAMPSANYAVAGSTTTPTTVARGGLTVGLRVFDDGSGTVPTASALRIQVRTGSSDVVAGLDADRQYISIAVFA
jgi:hypothetical protein